jgi:hypothetical protein
MLLTQDSTLWKNNFYKRSYLLCSSIEYISLWVLTNSYGYARTHLLTLIVYRHIVVCLHGWSLPTHQSFNNHVTSSMGISIHEQNSPKNFDLNFGANGLGRKHIPLACEWGPTMHILCLRIGKWHHSTPTLIPQLVEHIGASHILLTLSKSTPPFVLIHKSRGPTI